MLDALRRADDADQPRPGLLRDPGRLGEYILVDYVGSKRRKSA